MEPEQKFKAGGVEAAIWKKETDKGDIFNVSFERSYKDKKDAWQKTSSLNQNDLPKAIAVLSKAYEYLVLKEGKTSAKDAGVPEEVVV